MAEGYTLGQAYIQILPETTKLGSSLKSEAETKGSEAGSSMSSGFSKGLATVGKAAVAAVGAAATGISALVTGSVSAYADYEQLVGGIETLYGDSADTMIAYAEEAYKTAGLSANDYMETATSFAASLVQSLGGDTEQAAEYANTAITDMSDNANKMGTDMTAIQNAYQGFAKQNYTMLDNLKLGYGGTKSEMERLIEDANELKVAQGEVGDLTIDSYADIVEAIHLVQTEMGITGTTSSEAASTISGSINTMKASWENWLVSLADGNADISESTSELVESFETVLTNIEPVVQQILAALPEAIDAIVAEIPSLLGDFASILPDLIDSAVNLITSLASHLDEIIGPLIDALPDIISSLLDGLIDCLPDLITGVGTLIGQLAAELPSMLVSIVEALPDLIVGLAEGIGGAIRGIVEAVTGDTSWTDMISEMETKINELAEENDELARSIASTTSSYQESVDASEADAYAAEVLTNKLFALIEANDGTATSQQEIQTTVDLLNQTLPGLGLEYDSVTGSINLTKSAIYDYIDALKLEAQEEAAKEFYTDSLKEMYQAQLDLKQASADYSNTLSELNISQELYNSVMADGVLTGMEVAAVASELGIDWDQASDAMNTAIAAHDNMVTAMDNLATSAENTEYAEEVLGDVVTEVTDAMAEQAEVTSTEVTTSNEEMQTSAEETAETYSESMDEVQTAYDSVDGSGAVAEAQSTGEQMAAASDISDETGSNTAEAMEAMVDNISAKMSALSAAFNSIVLKASEKLGVQSQFQANLKVYGQKIPTLMGEGAEASEGQLTSAMDSIIGGIDSQASKLGSMMRENGSYAGQGLYNGLASWSSSLSSLAWSIANSINAAARSALQIKSPSRVMMEVGEYTGEGLAIGIENSADRVTDAMTTVTDSMKSSVTELSTELNATASEVTGNPVSIDGTVTQAVNGSIEAQLSQPNESTSIGILRQLYSAVDRLSKMQMVTDTGVLAGALAESMNQELFKLEAMSARG